MRTDNGESRSVKEFEQALGTFELAVNGLDLGEVDTCGVELIVGLVRRAQACTGALLVRAGLRADELAGQGLGAGARETLLGSGQVRGRTAGREADRAQLATRHEVLAKHLSAGDLGADHLDALVRRLGRLDDEHLARIDLALTLDGAAGLPADTFDARLRRAVDDAARPDEGLDENEQARANSTARHWFNHRTGMGHLSAELDPERYEAVANALDQMTTSLANSQGEEKNANLAAQALVDLITASGGQQSRLPLVTVVVDQTTAQSGRWSGTVAQTGDGHGLSDQAVSRLCCDAVLQRVTLDPKGVPIEVGRKHRTATDAQWAALRAVYSTCAWAGCDRSLSHCQAHHVIFWEHGGPTDLINLVPLCSHHHHLVHEGRWHLELLPDRSLRIIRPDGTVHAMTDRPAR